MWQEIGATAIAVLGVLGAGVRWLLTWVFSKIEANQKAYLDALEKTEEKFAAALKESHAATMAERDARIRDKDQHAETLLNLVGEIREAIVMRSDRPRQPKA